MSNTDNPEIKLIDLTPEHAVNFLETMIREIERLQCHLNELHDLLHDFEKKFYLLLGPDNNQSRRIREILDKQVRDAGPAAELPTGTKNFSVEIF